MLAAVHCSQMGKQKPYNGPDKPLVLALTPRFKDGKASLKYAEVRNAKKAEAKHRQKRVKQDTTLIVAEKQILLRLRRLIKLKAR